MMNSIEAEKIKREIIDYYESEALDINDDTWYDKGGSPKVPESPSSLYFVERKVSEAMKMSDSSPESCVIEIGCSFGHMTSLLAEHYKQVMAVDISPTSIEVARKRLEHYGIGNVKFIALDVEDMSDLSSDSFDIVYSFSTLRFCPDVKGALNEIARILHTNGRAVVDFPNKYCPWHLAIKSLLGIKRHIHDHLFSAKEVRNLFEEAGFTDIKHKYILFTSRRLPTALLPIFRTIDFLLERIPIINSLAGIIIVTGFIPLRVNAKNELSLPETH